MAINTYGTLKTAVENWLDDSNLTDRIPEFISLGEGMIYSEPRLIKLRTFETAANIDINAQEVSLSGGFLGVRRLYISGNPNRRLDYLPPDAFWKRHLSIESGPPKAYTISGDSFFFGPSPDQTYTGKLVYFKAPTAFSADSDNNELLTSYPNLYLYAALTHSAPFLGDDPRILVWTALYEQIVENLAKSNRIDRFPVPAQTRNDILVV